MEELNKEKNAKRYTVHGASVCALIGVIQAVVGAAIMVLSRGYIANIGGFLIADGVEDLKFAVNDKFSDPFPWKKYRKYKSRTMTITVLISMMSAGILRVLPKGTGEYFCSAQPMRRALMAAFQKIRHESIVRMVECTMEKGMDIFAKLLMKQFSTNFEDQMRILAKSNRIYCKSTAGIRTKLEKLVNILGKKGTECYLKEVVSFCSKLETECEATSWNVAGFVRFFNRLGNVISAAGKRIGESNLHLESMLWNTAKIIHSVMKVPRVLYGLKHVSDHIPTFYESVNNSLEVTTAEDYSTPDDLLTCAEKEEWINAQMQFICITVNIQVQELARSQALQRMMKQVIANNMNKCYGMTLDKHLIDYDILREMENMGTYC